MTGYEIYSAWCRERGRVPPTKEWWDAACAKPRCACGNRPMGTCPDCREHLEEIRADQAEIDRERREGWDYDRH